MALPIGMYRFGLSGVRNPALLAAIMQAQQNDAARTASDNRSLDVLELLGANRKRTMEGFDKLTDIQSRDANKRWDDVRNTLMTDLADRGFAPSTLRVGIEAKTNRERGDELDRIARENELQRMQMDLAITDRASRVMENRIPSYPQGGNSLSGLLAQLLAAKGGASGTRAAVPFEGRSPQLVTPIIQAMVGAGRPSVTGDPKEAVLDAERNRRRQMLGLYLAESGGQYGTMADAEKHQLQQMIMDGTAQYHPELVNRAPSLPFAPVLHGYADRGVRTRATGGGNYGTNYAVRKASYLNSIAQMKANRNNPNARWQPGAGQRQMQERGAEMLTNAGNSVGGAIGALLGSMATAPQYGPPPAQNVPYQLPAVQGDPYKIQAMFGLNIPKPVQYQQLPSQQPSDPWAGWSDADFENTFGPAPQQYTYRQRGNYLTGFYPGR